MKFATAIVLSLGASSLAAGEVEPLELKGQHGLYRLENDTFGKVSDGKYTQNVMFPNDKLFIQVEGSWRNFGEKTSCAEDAYKGYSKSTGVVIPDIESCVAYKAQGKDREIVFFTIKGSEQVYNKAFGIQRGNRVWVMGPKK